MLKYTVLLGSLIIVVLTSAGKPTPTSTAHSWQVDTKHSDTQIITDGTTDYGKSKINISLGFARMDGAVNLDDGDATKSSIDLHIYPATAMKPVIGEDGKFKNSWLESLPNQTLLCFHSKQVVRGADGTLKSTGELTLVRVDRTVEVTPGEGYSGPVYGPAMIHRVSHEATLIFNSPNDKSAAKDGGLELLGSTRVFREDFPQLVKAVTLTYWPPVVQDASCTAADANEAYSGVKCTGNVLQAPSLPPDPGTHVGEDYPGPQNFNQVTGERVNLVVHLRLLAKTGMQAALN